MTPIAQLRDIRALLLVSAQDESLAEPARQNVRQAIMYLSTAIRVQALAENPDGA
jgi:hypothetical protein